MCHDKSFANLSNQQDIFTLSLESSLVVANGLFWLLYVHESCGDKFEVFYRALHIEDLHVASSVVYSILELINIDLGLLLLSLDEASILRADFLEHVEGLLCISHFKGQIRLG